jgi:hypothetical protein
VAVEMAVLELHAGACSSSAMKRTSTSLRLSGWSRLPVGRDVPAEDDAVGRLVGEHGRPLALAAVGAAVVDAAADALLEHGLGDVDAEHVVLARLDAVHLLGEDRERPLDGALTTISVRTDVASAGVAITPPGVVVDDLLEGRQGLIPERVKLRSQAASPAGSAW